MINFTYENETWQVVDKQTYLGIEITWSGRYTCAREILSKKATKVLSMIKQSLSNTDSSTIAIKTKLFNALVKPVLLYGKRCNNRPVFRLKNWLRFRSWFSCGGTSSSVPDANSSGWLATFTTQWKSSRLDVLLYATWLTSSVAFTCISSYSFKHGISQGYWVVVWLPYVLAWGEL